MTTPAERSNERIDVNAWIGGYPFREVPHPEPAVLVKVLEREGFSGAWVGHLPGAFHRDPAPSNRALYAALAPHRATLIPAPIVRPDWPDWPSTLQDAVNEGAQSIRVYPAQWGLGPAHPGMLDLVRACGEAGVAVQVTVRFEDLRQRHAMDNAGDVSAAFIRSLARQSPAGAGGRTAIVVVGGSRELIEETNWGLTVEEQSNVFYDFHWVWGPPEEHFAHLVRTMGRDRLVWSSWWPLRLTQQARALIDLLPESEAARGTDFVDGSRIARLAEVLKKSAERAPKIDRKG